MGEPFAEELDSRLQRVGPSFGAAEDELPSVAIETQPGDLLVFDIPGASMTGVSQPGFPGQASHADLREIYASLRPVGDAACELTMRSPVAWAFGMNAGIGALVDWAR